MEIQSDTIAAFRFINCLREIGKTNGVIENIKNFIDETLMFKKEFEVMFIVPSREEKILRDKQFSDYYSKYIEIKTMKEVMYRLSNFPISDDPYDCPKLKDFDGYDGKRYEKYFVDPSCFSVIALEQLKKLKTLKEEINRIGEIL